MIREPVWWVLFSQPVPFEPAGFYIYIRTEKRSCSVWNRTVFCVFIPKWKILPLL